MCWKRSALALTAVVAVAACGDDSDSPFQPPADDHAMVQGRVEATQPEPAGYPSYAQMRQTGASASAVTVAEMTSSGSLNTVARGSVAADGSFTVDSVPADRDDLVIVAEDASGAIVGRAVLHERTRVDAVATAAPINHQTSLEALAWAELKARGEASMTSTEEVALLVRSRSDAAAQVVASGEATLVAEGLSVAADAMTRTYARAGTSFDAAARAEAFAQAAVEYDHARHAGATVEVAQEAFLSSALDATADAGVSMDAAVQATASAASTMDARLSGKVSARGQMVAEAVRLNLRARQRLAASLQSGAEADLALSIMDVLADAEADVRGAATAAQIRSTLDAHGQAAAEATIDGVVNFLLPPAAGVIIRSEVEARAQAAVEAARLSTRLSAAVDAEAAAEATANYRTEVRAAVQAMLEAAERTDLDVEAMTSLYIAAHGSAYVRA